MSYVCIKKLLYISRYSVANLRGSFPSRALIWLPFFMAHKATNDMLTSETCSFIGNNI